MDEFNSVLISRENDKLRGVVVLVHPDLRTDGLGMQNQVGVICEANIRLDDFYVDFRVVTGLYSADALFTFLPEDKIHENLAGLSFEDNADEIKTITQVDLTVRYGDVTAKINAMFLVRDNPLIQPYCVEILQNQISPDISNYYGRG
jgi:hypothetical protein